ncbi:hypothetical protein [Neisseria sp. Ec49-e6-T10]|uniref:hypothetical protein n=1 Tax=Neisseria sp. Ec49-e6-T10 TaxID=3140744 RepID=UPI003EC113EE
MYDLEFIEFAEREGITFSILADDEIDGYTNMEKFPFVGSRIAWSQLSLHERKNIAEVDEFYFMIQQLYPINDTQQIILFGYDFEQGYLIDFSALRLVLKFLTDYPGENYLLGKKETWCICVYDELDFGVI